MADLSLQKPASRGLAFKASLSEVWEFLRAVLTVIFYRAWIGTLGLVAVLIAFTGIFPKLGMVSEQTHDILRGIGDTITLASQQPDASEFLWRGIRAYIAVWLAALALAFVLALVTRVTGMLAFGQPSGRRAYDFRIHRVVELCSCAVLVATLAIIHLTFLSNLIGSLRTAFYGFGVVTALFLAVTVLPWIALRYFLPRAGRLSYVLAYAGIALVIFGLQSLPYFAVRDARTLVTIVSSLTPAAAAVALWMMAPGLSRRACPWVSLLVLSAALLTFALCYPSPPDLVLATGSIPVVLIFLAWLACALALGLLLLYGVNRFVSVDRLLVVVVVVVAIAYLMPPERFGQEKLGPFDRPQAASGESTKAAPQAISDQAGASEKPAIANRLAIHADGGGLRAALFTAATLAWADDMTCGEFGAHVLAASGVSGGSLGIATWVAMRQEFKQRDAGAAWRECREARVRYLASGKESTENIPAPLTILVFNTLAQDHLSNALAGMLTSDLFRPGGDASRGQALLDSWQNAALSALASGQPSPPAARMFATPLEEADAGVPDAPPLLLFSATDADTGERVIFSNAKWQPHSAYKSMPIGVAALHSARFPVISPAGAVRDAGKWIRVVDGGYFDNSGAATLRQMLGEARANQTFTGTVVAARINGNAAEEEDKQCGPFFDAIAEKGYSGWRLPLSRPAQEPKHPAPAADDVTPNLPPKFGGWSGSSAYFAARLARANEAVRGLNQPEMNSIIPKVLAHEQLDYFAGFEPTCADEVPKRPAASADPLPECVVKNLAACFAGRLAPRAPLGWYLSYGSARAIVTSAFHSARRIVRQSGLDFVGK
jgi:hypothetical protein